MRKAEEYIARIRKYDHAALVQLWNKIQNNQRTGFPPGTAFEYLLLRAFELENAKVIWPYEVKPDGYTIEQIDGIIYSGSLCCLVEAKEEIVPKNIEPVAKLRGQLLRRPAAAVGVIFSKSGFTLPAKILTRFTFPQTILLWERKEITPALEKQKMRIGLHRKFRYAIENGLPDFDLTSPQFDWTLEE